LYRYIDNPQGIYPHSA
jgi:hypothetical protein